MAVPGFQDLMLPILQILKNGNVYTFSEVADELVRGFDLAEDDLRETLPSGRQTKFANRFSWARIYLREAGLIEINERKALRITTEGLQVLTRNPARVDIKFLGQFPKFIEFRQRGKNNERQQEHENVVEQTPEEIFDLEYQNLRRALAKELLAKVKSSSPSFFENLVIDLLVTMGYGGSRNDAAKVGRSGDDGIDGIIKEDKLGLDAIYIQAKKWENSVGRPIVQAFAGSLEGQRARKGILITSSYFTEDAKDYVKRIEKRIVLIDGDQLTQLMIDYGVGVSEKAIYVVKRVDEDYFNQE